MKFLICSDGTPASENAVRLASQLAPAARAELTLLGIAEEPTTEQSIRAMLEQQAVALRDSGLIPQIRVRSGEPIAQVITETSTTTYDIVIIGARRKRVTGHFSQSPRTYEIIKSIEPPVLVAIGRVAKLARFLLCTGGKRYIDEAVRLSGKLAAAVGAEATLLHVMAEPPAIYADLVQMEEDVNALLSSHSELGRNLTAEKQSLEKLGVPATVRVRHGIVVEQVLEEQREGNYDLIISGSSRARGPFRHYIMGDLTRTILNRAECPVLVARSSPRPGRSLVTVLRDALFSKRPEQ